MITVYGNAASGNCWKVAQILRLTGRAYEWAEVDANAGETRAPAFLAINPRAKVPCVRLDDGQVVSESNAILVHFAEGTAWFPPGHLVRTRILEWLFWEQYSHEPSIAVARNLRHNRGEAHLYPERMAQCMAQGSAALTVMQERLGGHDWLTDAGPTVADISLYAYTHVADQGGFDLAAYPGVAAWLGRFALLPGVAGMR